MRILFAVAVALLPVLLEGCDRSCDFCNTPVSAPSRTPTPSPVPAPAPTPTPAPAPTPPTAQGCTRLDPQLGSQAFNFPGPGEGSFNVSVAQATDTWMATSVDPAWLLLNGSSTGTTITGVGSGRVSFRVLRNNGQARSSKIRLSCGLLMREVEVRQAGV